MPTNIWNDKRMGLTVDYNRPWYKEANALFSLITFPNANIIELGCGCGEFADTMIKNGKYVIKYTGIDGSFNSAATVRNRSGYDISLANFESPLPLPSTIADIVISLEVIEHIANSERFLDEISRILKPNGHLILSTPNVGFLGSRLNYLIRAEVLQEGVHLRFFNRSILLAITSMAGLKYEKQRSCMPWLGYNTIARLFHLGSARYRNTPQFLETLLATNFVWLLRKRIM